VLDQGVDNPLQVEQEIFLLLVHQALLFKEPVDLLLIQVHQIMDLLEVVEHVRQVLLEVQQQVELVEQAKLI
tara:strand:- start:117 stop:332 length:216 start_codon:yes stop_codon:yes gene_type:complete